VILYPREIEELLHALPDVAGGTRGRRAERLLREEVMAWGRIVDGSPMTVTGKVQKYRLRELAAAA
jgi:hypothetical protein